MLGDDDCERLPGEAAVPMLGQRYEPITSSAAKVAAAMAQTSKSTMPREPSAPWKSLGSLSALRIVFLHLRLDVSPGRSSVWAASAGAHHGA
jgi:hypothetical protein